MKIGILTLPLHTNYGGILQAYAMQNVLERMGHEVEVFDKPDQIHRPLWRNSMTFAKRLALRAIGKSISLNYQKEYNIRERAKRKYVNVFIQKYIRRRIVNRYEDISPNDYDAIVVGSDQVWRRDYMPENDVRIAYLDFTKGWNIKRLAYAASFGIDSWTYNKKDTQIAKQAIQRFNAVSTREKTGVELCKKYLDYADAIQVLDPTMLLDKSDYESLVAQSQQTHKPDGDVMLYILDYTDDKREFVKMVAEKLNLRPFDTNSKYEVKGASLDEIVQPPVEQWIRSFMESSFVITDSFHACVFSILFHKPFIVIGNKKRGMTRLESLLYLFGLEERLIYNLETPKESIISIDWNNVNAKLNLLRSSSCNFLNIYLSL